MKTILYFIYIGIALTGTFVAINLIQNIETNLNKYHETM
jgi:hypothetical protein